MKDYEILEQLPAEGLGMCFLARQRSLGRQVRLKVLDSISPTQWHAFAREAHLLTSVSDHRIVKIHDFGRDGQGMFYSQEIPEGSSLAALNPADLSVKDFAVLMKEIAEALHKLHSMGIIHRNLRPDNLYRHPSGSPKIAGMGLARSVARQSLTQHSQYYPDQDFLSPEQESGPKREIDHRSDLYSLGMVFTVLLKRFRIPGFLKRILARCTARNPDQRYPTAMDLAEDLERFLLGEARISDSWLTPLLRPRAPLVAAIFLALFGIWLFFPGDESSRNPRSDSSTIDYQARARSQKDSLPPNFMNSYPEHMKQYMRYMLESEQSDVAKKLASAKRPIQDPETGAIYPTEDVFYFQKMDIKERLEIQNLFISNLPSTFGKPLANSANRLKEWRALAKWDELQKEESD